MKRLKIKLLIIIPLIILLLIITFIVYKQLTKSNTSVANLENKNSILTDKNWQINKPTHEIQTNPLYSGLADYEDEEESIYTLESVLDPNVKYYIDPIIRKDTSVTGSDVCTMIEEDVQNYQPVVINPFVSIMQMLRGSIILFTAILTLTYRHKKLYAQLTDSNEITPEVDVSLEYLYTPGFEIHTEDKFRLETLYDINTGKEIGNVYFRTQDGFTPINNIPIALRTSLTKDISPADLYTFSINYYGKDTGTWDLDYKDIHAMLEEQGLPLHIGNYVISLEEDKLYVRYSKE